MSGCAGGSSRCPCGVATSVFLNNLGGQTLTPTGAATAPIILDHVQYFDYDPTVFATDVITAPGFVTILKAGVYYTTAVVFLNTVITDFHFITTTDNNGSGVLTHGLDSELNAYFARFGLPPGPSQARNRLSTHNIFIIDGTNLPQTVAVFYYLEGVANYPGAGGSLMVTRLAGWQAF
jgi:hypothetical protein